VILHAKIGPCVSIRLLYDIFEVCTSDLVLSLHMGPMPRPHMAHMEVSRGWHVDNSQAEPVRLRY
jgi:hypothetical protein